MPKSPNQKLKLLYLMKILMEETDENNVLSLNEIIARLGSLDISCERKSLYDDMECLRRFGVDVMYRHEAKAGYYVASRDFELAELKLLVDAVQSSKFITQKKSNDLIKKIESLASHQEAYQLQRQVYVQDRNKAVNENIFYNVDKIHCALAANVKIQFNYFEWTLEKKMKLRRDGTKYNVSPWALLWDNENYYLVGVDEDVNQIRHYRVDKMVSIEITKDKRTGENLYRDFDIAKFGKKTFGMFGGEERDVVLLCDNKMIGVIIDRFGQDVRVLKKDDCHFTAHVKVSISPQFFGWIAGLEGLVRIQGPDDVVREWKGYLEKLF